MRASVAPLFFVLLSGIIAVIVLVSAPTTHAQIAAGCHAITDAERAALEKAGAKIPSSGQFCDKDKELIYGASCPESPVPYLESKRENGGVDVAHLNPDFACRLYRFIKASDAEGKRIKITSGYRSIAKQADLYRACQARGNCTTVAPPGRSKHNYGIAVDLTFDGVWPNTPKGNTNTVACIQRYLSCRWAHEKSSTYGLRWPMVYESWHIEPGTAVRGGEQLPSDPAYWSSDSGTNYNGAPFVPYQPLPQPSIMNSPAPAVTPTQTPTTQTQTQTPSTNQPQVCDPKLSCSGNVTYYQTSSCTTQVYQVCQYGCSTTGSACATSTSTAATSTRNQTGTGIDITNKNSNDNDNATTGPSVSELLDRMVNPVSFTSTEIGTSTSLVFRLNPDTGDIETLDDSERPKDAVAPGTITSVQPPPGQQTFTSDDLANTYNGQYGTQSSTFQSVLDGLKSALMWALNVLRGLSGTTAA
ncbi:MAG: M15 family metallopeptidase [Patescibacteria group bacterium]|mgnify:CR=1 FL=1